MAAPHVAGAAALIQQYSILMNGSMVSPAQIKNALVSTGKSVTRDVTKPRIDVYRALMSFDFPGFTLSSGAVSHVVGNTSTVFNYTVVYTSAKAGVPSYVRVHINGTGYSMTGNSTNYASGVMYHYETTLAAGDYRYYFNASDGSLKNVTDSVNNPRVNHPPTLSGSVSPTLGDDTTLFNFTVTYTDADNEPPISMQVAVGGSSYDMQSMGSTYLSGVLYYYNQTLTSGTTNYRFTVDDGNYTIQSSLYSNAMVYDSTPDCTGINPTSSASWNIDIYTNCTSTAVLPTSTRTGTLNITAGATLNLTSTYVYLNNTMLYLDGRILLDNSVIAFLL